MAIDKLREAAERDGVDWRQTINSAAVEAELAKLNQRGYSDETADRVGIANRGVRFVNLTDEPLLCNIVDAESGESIGNGEHDLSMGPYEATTVRAPPAHLLFRQPELT